MKIKLFISLLYDKKTILIISAVQYLEFGKVRNGLLNAKYPCFEYDTKRHLKLQIWKNVEYYVFQLLLLYSHVPYHNDTINKQMQW